MPGNNTKSIGVLFGGRSVEHEVSVITGIQALHALDSGRYRAVPIYVSKGGDWHTGERLADLDLYKDLESVIGSATAVRPAANPKGGADLVATSRRLFSSDVIESIDVLLLAMHGAEGENGSLQGALEVMDVPYTGSDVASSAIGMDKSLSKIIARAAGVPVLEELVIPDSDWIGNEDAWIERCEREMGFPVIVKPMRLGSSIGIAVAEDGPALESALEDVFRLDLRAMVEPCIRNLREFNCSVLERAEGPVASVVEEPVKLSGSDLLSFEQKYERGGRKGAPKTRPEDAGMASLDRIIPADVPGGREDYLRDLAVRVFQAIGCSGIARVDFLYDEDKDAFFFNEINTIPGSFSFYLWKPSGIEFDVLLDELIQGALRHYHSRNAKVRSYETNLLSLSALSGLKK